MGVCLVPPQSGRMVLLACCTDAGETVGIIPLAHGKLLAGVEQNARAVDTVDEAFPNQKGLVRAHKAFVKELLFQPHHRGVKLELLGTVIDRDDSLLNFKIADVLDGHTAALPSAGEHEHFALTAGFSLAGAQKDFLKFFGGGLVFDHIVQCADVVAFDGMIRRKSEKHNIYLCKLKISLLISHANKNE